MRHHARTIAGAVMAAAFLLTGCAGEDAQQSSSAEVAHQDLLQAYGLADMDAVEMIDHLDRVPLAERSTDLTASVMPEQLVLATAEEELALNLPEDSFYVSIAPFVNQTHECRYHSLTTCVGELGEEDIHVTVTDDSGEVLVDEQRTTFDNGFVGVWVPADTSGTIEISYADMTGTTDFASDDDAATCITDLQLT